MGRVRRCWWRRRWLGQWRRGAPEWAGGRMLSRKDSGCGCTDTDTDIRLPQIPVLMPTLGDGQGRTSSALNCSAGLLVCLAPAQSAQSAHLRLDSQQFSREPCQPPTANHLSTQPHNRAHVQPQQIHHQAPLYSLYYFHFRFPHQFQVRGETVLFPLPLPPPVPAAAASLPPPVIRAPHATCSKL